MHRAEKNAFGLKLYAIKDIFNDPDVAEDIYITLLAVLDHLGVSTEKSKEYINQGLKLAKNYQSLSEYEEQAHNLLEQTGVTQKISVKLAGRTATIYNQIQPHLAHGSILDLGCGDGKTGQLLVGEGYKIVLADIYKDPNIDHTGLEFRMFGQGDAIPAATDEFDNCLALTVFHHSDDPKELIKELKRVTKNNGRVVVIESVYGVDGFQLSKQDRQELRSYARLDAEQQRMVNIFFDHFYNRVINYSNDPLKKANVPYNFNTPDGWKKIFEENGLKQEKVIHLGVDQPIVPEYHTLHVLRVVK